jgi:hypothetical protein
MGAIQVTCIAQINFRNIDTMVAKLTDKCELGKTGKGVREGERENGKLAAEILRHSIDQWRKQREMYETISFKNRGIRTE